MRSCWQLIGHKDERTRSDVEKNELETKLKEAETCKYV